MNETEMPNNWTVWTIIMQVGEEGYTYEVLFFFVFFGEGDWS